jgi:hypothetical protein
MIECICVDIALFVRLSDNFIEFLNSIYNKNKLKHKFIFMKIYHIEYMFLLMINKQNLTIQKDYNQCAKLIVKKLSYIYALLTKTISCGIINIVI